MLAASLSLALLQTPPATAPPPPTPSTAPDLAPATATAPESAAQPTAPADAFAPLSGGQPTPAAPPPAYPPGYQATDPSPPPFVNRPPAAAPRELPESTTHRKLVFQNTYAVNFGAISFIIPSGDFSFFLGSNLKPRRNLARTFDWHTALGYQLTLSVGGADAHSGALFVQRHHFTATGYGGAKQRFYYSAGGGVWMRGSTLLGIEVETKLGGRFAVREDSRVSGVVGGQFRLGGVLDEGIPLPQFGVFLGFLVF
jgi:hypothetical protein